MGMVTERLIGLTQERAIEERTGVTDLHIGWQREYAQQDQRDPCGHLHRAPVVTWQYNGALCQYVPRLAFRPNLAETAWIRRLLCLEHEAEFRIDSEALAADIESMLLRTPEGQQAAPQAHQALTPAGRPGPCDHDRRCRAGN